MYSTAFFLASSGKDWDRYPGSGTPRHMFLFLRDDAFLEFHNYIMGVIIRIDLVTPPARHQDWQNFYRKWRSQDFLNQICY